MTWRIHAACRHVDVDMFDRYRYKRAQKVCNGCTVDRECLDYALRTGQDEGVWGGKTPEQRAGMRGRVRR